MKGQEDPENVSFFLIYVCRVFANVSTASLITVCLFLPNYVCIHMSPMFRISWNAEISECNLDHNYTLVQQFQCQSQNSWNDTKRNWFFAKEIESWISDDNFSLFFSPPN